MFKKIVSFIAATFMAALIAVPAFADTASCTFTNGESDISDKASEEAAICKALGKLYGTEKEIKYNKDSATNELPYAVAVSTATGTINVYVEQKPTINDVGVSIGSDGNLNVTGIGQSNNGTWNQIFSKYKDVIVGISGIATITFVAFFIINIIKLGKSASNPNAHSAALQGVLWTGVAAALLGAVTIIAGFFYNAL